MDEANAPASPPERGAQAAQLAASRAVGPAGEIGQEAGPPAPRVPSPEHLDTEPPPVLASEGGG